MFSTFGGVVWASTWRGIGEGPYTLAAKFLKANSLRTSYLRKGILWPRGKIASLLDPCPASNNETAAMLGQMLHQASLAARIPNLYKELATDRELRYCRKCMSSGFQAAIAQIVGIDRCPIHGEIHRSTCTHCGAKTQPYCLADNLLPSFSCNECGSPFGGDLLIDRRLDTWTIPEHVDRLDPIHLWLERVNGSKDIQWLNVSDWSAIRQSPDGSGDHTRYAVFDVLRSLLLPDETLPESNSDQKPVLFGPFPLARGAKSSKQLTNDEYQLIMRRVALPQDFQYYREHFRTPSFCVAVPVTPQAPVYLHAHLIWRAQFENFWPSYSEPYSRKDFCSDVIPELLGIRISKFEDPICNRSVIEGIMTAAWSVSLRIAVEWHQMQRCFDEMPVDEAKQRWLTGIDQWANRLGCWRDRYYFPIAAIKVKDKITREKQLFLVVA